MQSTTIDRPNLNEIISEHIKRQIFEGELEPGAKIVEDEIAQSVGTSRTPVKIALTELSKGGLVELIPRRGAFVRQFTHIDILELYEIRQAFEGLAGRLAARHIGERELEELEKLNTSYRKSSIDSKASSRVIANQLRKTKKIDLQFHRIVVKSTGNRHLADLMGLDMIEFLSFLLVDPVDPGRVVNRSADDHKAIIAALRSRDEDTAETLSKQHIRKAMEILDVKSEA